MFHSSREKNIHIISFRFLLFTVSRSDSYKNDIYNFKLIGATLIFRLNKKCKICIEHKQCLPLPVRSADLSYEQEFPKETEF